MRTPALAALLLLSLPALAAPQVDVPPPPPLPAHELEGDGRARQPRLIETASRGQLLYENHCMSCHESVAAIRARRTVRSQADLRAAVARWSANSKLPWGREEVEDITDYLNARHYRFAP